MNSKTEFSGFPIEGLNFLKNLKNNNNREWFENNRSIYNEYLIAPAQEFIMILGQKLAAFIPDIRFDTRTNGSGSLMRIYRDIRFSPDKSPYKSYLGIGFWEGAGKRIDNPGFFIRIESHQATLYTGKYMFSKKNLDAYRNSVNDPDKGLKLEKILAHLRSTQIQEIGNVHYKRVPQGFDPEHERAELLKYNGMHTIFNPFPKTAVLSPDFVDLCLNSCKLTFDLHAWLMELTG
ncbi:MAG: DUF2461 domain-containing protein [Candidatus Neomarinimicrobiota bacterium]